MNISLVRILSTGYKRVIEQAKFTYSPLGKALQKQAKTIKEQGEKQIEALKKHEEKQVEPLQALEPQESIKELLQPESMLNEETRREVGAIKEIEKKLIRRNLIYDTGEQKYDFSKFKTIRGFGESISKYDILLGRADREQSVLG